MKEVVALVRSAIHQKESDGGLAKALHKLVLKERLDDRTIEELESEGAGPKAVAALVDLRDASEDYPLPAGPPMFLSPPSPSRDESHRILMDAARHAMSYTRGLPDFICTETVRRWEHIRNIPGWRLKDTLTVKLTYFEYREKYDLVAVNNHPTTLTYRTAGGATSEGDFGTILLAIFDPQSETHLGWDHWTTLRGHTAHVFAYRIEAPHSTYRLLYTWTGQPQETISGAHGFIYLDRETGEILRLIRIADIDPAFPVKSATLYLDYDFADVAGRRYLVPMHLDTRMATNRLDARNEVVFHDYRKFSGDSNITFDTAPEGKP